MSLIHSRGYLSHIEGAELQFITYRLIDALPRHVMSALIEKKGREQILAIDQSLDFGYGSCVLRDPKNAKIVIENWRHFDGLKYQLLSYVVMPNHVHVLIRILNATSLSSIVHSWKSYTAKSISIPGRSQVWYREYFDRYIRDENHFFKVIHYIMDNPMRAGLCSDRSDWAWSWCNPDYGGFAGGPPAVP